MLLPVIVAFVGTPPTPLAKHPVAKPTAAQLAWMDLEVASMITWNLQTICTHGSNNATAQPCQVGSAGFVPTRSAVAQWNPSALDTDAWARASAAFGAKYVILVADHMTGFTLWDTKTHNYSIAHTQYRGGGGDVVREMIASCARFGLRLGVFYSAHFNWFLGVNDFAVGHPPLGPRNYTQAEYSAVAEAQIAELLGIFGDDEPAFELWFDGGLDPKLDTGIMGAVRRSASQSTLCHGCFNTSGGAVRWMGNEAGVQQLPSWGAVADDALWSLHGDPLGSRFNPPVCDTVLREHYWFYQPGTVATLKSTRQLVDNYLTSVGRASNLILNIAPDDTGAIPPVDSARYSDLGDAIRCLFSKPVAQAAVRGGGAAGGAARMDPATGVMEPPTTFAKPLPWGPTANFSLVLQEDQTSGQLIGNFSLECLGSADTTALPTWTPCPMLSLGTTIPAPPVGPGVGHKRILLLGGGELASVSAIRLVVGSHFATGEQLPALRGLTLYDWSGSVESCV